MSLMQFAQESVINKTSGLNVIIIKLWLLTEILAINLLPKWVKNKLKLVEQEIVMRYLSVVATGYIRLEGINSRRDPSL